MCRVQYTCGKLEISVILQSFLVPARASVAVAVFVFKWVKDQLSGESSATTLLHFHTIYLGTEWGGCRLVLQVRAYRPAVCRARFC